MLRMDNANMNFNGTSIIEEVVVATMNASYSGGSEIYFSFSVVNYDSYKTNKVLVEADFSDFCVEVLEAVEATKAEAAKG